MVKLDSDIHEYVKEQKKDASVPKEQKSSKYSARFKTYLYMETIQVG